MKTRPGQMVLRILLALIAGCFISGCEKFVKQESENLAPFAKQTIDLVGTLEYSLTDAQVLYLSVSDQGPVSMST